MLSAIPSTCTCNLLDSTAARDRHQISMRTSAVLNGMEVLSCRESCRLCRLLGQKVFSILVAAIAILAASPIYAQPSRSARHVRRGREEAMSRRKARLDASKINNPDTRDFVGPHSEGEAVVRAAILLSRLKFSPGEITSSYSDNLAKAIAAFQSVSGLSAMGAVDAATWTALNAAQPTRYPERVQQNSGGPGREGTLNATVRP